MCKFFSKCIQALQIPLLMEQASLHWRYLRSVLTYHMVASSEAEKVYIELFFWGGGGGGTTPSGPRPHSRGF
jgi:hypothetical protein